MPARGVKPTDGPKHHRNPAMVEWTEVEDVPFTGVVPVEIPDERMVGSNTGPITVEVTDFARDWWATVSSMPHCILWADSDWQFALASFWVADTAFRGSIGAAGELRTREKWMGCTWEARRDLRIRYVPQGSLSAVVKPSAVAAIDGRRARLTSAS